jgi:1-acyl-sn-glycerol-3-phosphate acyltransferase
MAVLRSLAFYLVFYTGSIVHVLSALLALALGSRHFQRISRAWSAYHAACVRVLLGIEVRIEGTVPSGPVIVAFKHESFFEAINMPFLLDRPVVFAKAELLRIPLWGRVGRAAGLIPVERDQGAKALRVMVSEARRLTAEGRPLAISPEGRRIPHGEKPALQSGFAGLYKLLALPVVPMAINSGPLYHRRWKRSGVMTLRFGEIIPPGLPRAEIEARVWAAINVLNG